MRAALAVDASFSGALAMESAAVALGLAGRVPDREVLWVPPGRGVPKSFGDWHVVRLAVGDDVTLAAMEALVDVEVDGFVFRIPELGGDGRHAQLEVGTPFGRPGIGARVEISQWLLSWPPDVLPMAPLPMHGRYDVAIPDTPVIAVEEAIAEKLARFRRVSLARDLYDLAWFADRQLDQARMRRLWVTKVYFDVVDNGRGTQPLSPDDVLRQLDPNEFVPEDIGYLTQPVDIAAWLAVVSERYAFLRDLDEQEQRWAMCSPDHRCEARTNALAPFR